MLWFTCENAGDCVGILVGCHGYGRVDPCTGRDRTRICVVAHALLANLIVIYDGCAVRIVILYVHTSAK